MEKDIPYPTHPTPSDPTQNPSATGFLRSVFYCRRFFAPTSRSQLATIDRAHDPPSRPPAGESNRTSVRPPAGESTGDAPPAALPLAFMRLSPPCFLLRRRSSRPRNTLLRWTLRHPAPPAAIGGLTLGRPTRTTARPSPLPIRRGTLVWPPISRFGPSPATL